MAITNGYCTDTQLKAALAGKFANDDDQAARELAIEAASREIDGWCGWRFWQDSTAQIRTFYADTPNEVWLVDDDSGDGISTTTGLVVKIDADGDGTFETTVTVNTDFVLRPTNAATRNPAWPYTSLWMAANYSWPVLANGRPGVQITAKYGWPAVPRDVEQACVLQAVMLYKSKDAAFGVVELGETGAATTMRSTLHPAAKALLASYRKPSVG